MKALALRGFTRSEWLFSLKSFAAAMLALFVASAAGLPRPFWAVLTTYVVAQPLAGTVRSKVFFRFCGTLVGSIATVVLVPTLSNAPELLVVALALWVGLCLYLSLQNRGPGSYVFMLAGYTAALIGFPAVEVPQQVFEIAVTRVEEIGIGILCATAVHSLVFPTGMAPTLLGLVDRTLSDTGRWFRDLLKPGRKTADDRRDVNLDRQRLAVDLTALRLLSTHLPFDTGPLRWSAGTVGAMQDAAVALTPVLSAVEDRLKALSALEGDLAPDTMAVLAQTGRWLSATGVEDGHGPVSAKLREELRASLRAFGGGPLAAPEQPDAAGGSDAADAHWRRGLRIALAERLDELADGWQKCCALRRAIGDGLDGRSRPLRNASGVGHRVLHRDPGLALLSALAAVLAICLCGAFWIATAWPSGAGAIMMAAVFCCFFATLDDPSLAIDSFLKFTLYSMPISLLYVLVLPSVQDFGLLVIVCAPVLLLLGCFTARPATAVPGLVMTFGVLGTLTLHDTGSVDVPSFINSNLAQIVGISAAALVTRLVRTVGADRSARRIGRAIRRELGALAATPRAEARHDAYAVRMVDRISLIAPRLAQGDPVRRDAAADDMLRDLRTGADIVALQRARPALPAAALARCCATSRAASGMRRRTAPAVAIIPSACSRRSRACCPACCRPTAPRSPKSNAAPYPRWSASGATCFPTPRRASRRRPIHRSHDRRNQYLRAVPALVHAPDARHAAVPLVLAPVARRGRRLSLDLAPGAVRCRPLRAAALRAQPSFLLMS